MLSETNPDISFQKGSFGYDLHFLKLYDVVPFKYAAGQSDGGSRGKLGVSLLFGKHFARSNDSQNKLLTITNFDLDSASKCLKQESNTTKPSFICHALNAYNDGPLADSQMGSFYEIGSVSPAAFFKSGQSFYHKQSVYHFAGNKKSLKNIAEKLLGVSLSDIEKAF